VPADGALPAIRAGRQTARAPSIGEMHGTSCPEGEGVSADFDPAILHDWPEHEAAMIALARRWAAAGRNNEATWHGPAAIAPRCHAFTCMRRVARHASV
jgi:hypothetical protein